MVQEPAERITILTRVQGRPVLDSRGAEVGTLKDLVVLFRGMYPRVSKLSIARASGGDLLVPWEAVAEIAVTPGGTTMILDRPTEELIPSDLKANEMALGRNILDKKVMDTHRWRVVRVNDVQLEWREGGYHVLAVLAGMRSLLRRLFAAGLVRSLVATFGITIPRDVVSWEHVEPIETELTRARKQAVYTKLAQLHPADIADIVEELNPSERAVILDALDAEPPAEAEDVAELLEHEEDTAGGLMTTGYVTLRPEPTVSQALEVLRTVADEAETIYYFYVTDPSERLVGVLSLRELLVSKADQRLDEIMVTQFATVRSEATIQEVAETLSKYNLMALPVVDAEGRLEGIVTVDDVLNDLIPMIWKRRAAKKYI